MLGFVRGKAEVRFDGEDGPVVTVEAGDVVVIPAGMRHKRESSTGDLSVVGAYPGDHGEGFDPDMKRDSPARHRAQIDAVAPPLADPVHGADGPLLRLWADGAKRR